MILSFSAKKLFFEVSFASTETRKSACTVLYTPLYIQSGYTLYPASNKQSCQNEH
jgi:hypothetical protein